jgi:hypothetical protein
VSTTARVHFRLRQRRLKRVLVGRAVASDRLEHTLLRAIRAPRVLVGRAVIGGVRRRGDPARPSWSRVRAPSRSPCPSRDRRSRRC